MDNLASTIVDVVVGNRRANSATVGFENLFDSLFDALRPASRHKRTSKQIIASMQDCELETVECKECPICYEPYENKKAVKNPKDSGVDQMVSDDIKLRDEFINELNLGSGLHLPIFSENSKFNDPSLFMSLDEGGVNYYRFPTRNLVTLEPPKEEDLLPGYEDVLDEIQSQEPMLNQDHYPVKLADCAHIFGKPCIVEWLKTNVSCPLCRKEVKALKGTKEPLDVRQMKLERLKNVITSNFSSSSAILDDLMDHSTDMLNPSRRPFAANITPLSDSYMSQGFAAPNRNFRGNTCPMVACGDPDLVLPHKFPIPHFSVISPSRQNLYRTETVRRENSTENSVHDQYHDFLSDNESEWESGWGSYEIDSQDLD